MFMDIKEQDSYTTVSKNYLIFYCLDFFFYILVVIIMNIGNPGIWSSAFFTAESAQNNGKDAVLRRSWGKLFGKKTH